MKITETLTLFYWIKSNKIFLGLLSRERCSLISWLLVTVRCSEGLSSLTALQCPHTRRQGPLSTEILTDWFTHSHIPTLHWTNSSLANRKRMRKVSNYEGREGRIRDILHRLPFKRKSLIKCSSEDLHKQRGSGRQLVELYNHYYRHGGRGGGCGGG